MICLKKCLYNLSFLKIMKKDIPEYLGWAKLVLTLSSGGLGGLYAAGIKDGYDTSIKIAVTGFLVCIFAFIVFYTALIEHGNGEENLNIESGKTTNSTYISLLFGYVGFGVAISALLLKVWLS